MSDERENTGSKPDLEDVRARLDALEGKLDRHRPQVKDEAAAPEDRSSYAMAFRVSSDFIAAIFVGGLLGWFLDSFAGTSPFGLIILLMLGFAAGVLNVMRTLGLVAAPKGFADKAATRRHDTEKEGGEGR